MTTFQEQGLKRRHDGSVVSLVYAPKHINVMRHSITLQLAEYNSQENSFKHSRVNMNTSYLVPYKCLDVWRKWKGHNTPILEKQSYEDLILCLQENVSGVIANVGRHGREKEVERKWKDEKVKLKTSGSWDPQSKSLGQSNSLDLMLRDHAPRPISWDNSQRPRPIETETQCGIIKGTSRGVTHTTGALPMSISMIETMMAPDSWSRTPEVEEQKKHKRTTCPWKNPTYRNRSSAPSHPRKDLEEPWRDLRGFKAATTIQYSPRQSE